MRPASVDAWEAFYHPPNYHVDGALVYGIPNDGSGKERGWLRVIVVALDSMGLTVLCVRERREIRRDSLVHSI